MADVLSRLGVERALVFHAEDGMDELSTVAPSRVIELEDGRRQEYLLDSIELGLPRATVEAVRGGGAAENAAIARDLLAGETGRRRLCGGAARRSVAGDRRDEGAHALGGPAGGRRRLPACASRLPVPGRWRRRHLGDLPGDQLRRAPRAPGRGPGGLLAADP